MKNFNIKFVLQPNCSNEYLSKDQVSFSQSDPKPTEMKRNSPTSSSGFALKSYYAFLWYFDNRKDLSSLEEKQKKEWK